MIKCDKIREIKKGEKKTKRARKNFLDKLIETNKLSEFIQMANDGYTQRQISEHFKVAQSTINLTLSRIKEKPQEKKHEEPERENTEPPKPTKSAYDILYENRRQVVEWRKQGVYNVEIAKRMGVSDKDVFDFFDKRTKLTPKQIADIKKSYTNGKTIEAISQQYNTHPETIKKICRAVVVAEEETLNEGQEDIFVDLNCIKEFQQFLKQVEYKISWTTEEHNKVDKEISDIMHKIELENYSDKDGMEMLAKIKELRQHRRECKDYLTLIQPLQNFLTEQKNADTLKMLTNIAGNINNKAKASQNRIYYLRTKEEE